jgi:HK97 family phage major capsid protein/HK97 family phage prohead protease
MSDSKSGATRADVRPPRDNIIRAARPGIELRAATVDGSLGTLTGHFSVFDTWYEVDSMWEGHFMECVAPGAFRKTIAENRDAMRVTFNHGQDPQLGDKVLGPIQTLEEDSTGAFYEVPLLDTSYNRDLLPGLKAGVYGSSFRFRVVKEEIVQEPEPSAANPRALPERTIREAAVSEFGPVTYPANAGATAGMRSLTDLYALRRFVADPAKLSRLVASMEDQSSRSLDDLAAYLLADPKALAAAIDKLSRGEPLMVQEAEMLEAAIEHLEPPDDDADDDMTNALPRTGAERAHSGGVEPQPATPTKPQETTIVSDYVTRDEKAARTEELKSSIAARAVEYTGVFPADVQDLDDRENAEYDTLMRDIAAWDKRMERLRDMSTQPKLVEVPATGAPTVIRNHPVEDIFDLGKLANETRTRDEYDRRVRENALRAIDGTRLYRGKLDGVRDIIEHGDEGEDGKGEIARRILLTGSPAYRRAFNKYLRGETALWTQEEARAAALAVTGTTTTGGYAVPYVFDPTILHIGAWTAQNPFRSACRTETITNGNNWLQATVGAITAAYGAEAATTSEGGPTFDRPSYTVQTARAFATVSIEAMEDRPDITDELTSLFSEAKDTLEENEFAVGVGTTVHPMGMFTTTAYTNQDTATNDTTAIADIHVLEGALPLRYRANGAFFLNRSTIRQLQALDTTYAYFSGAGIYYPGQSNPVTVPSGNTGLRLLGYPVWEVPSAVSTLTTDGAIIVVFCDPRSYVIVDRIGMNVEVIPQMLSGATPNFPTLQRGVVCYWRNTAKPINADAGRSLSVQ